MPGDFNDVVRHVILRIVVDQEGLAEELGKARAKLKGLKDSESESNRERTKSNDAVTKGIEAQTKELAENQKAHEASAKSAVKGGKDATEATKEHTEAVKTDTKAVENQAAAAVKAAEKEAAAARVKAERDAKTAAKEAERQKAKDERDAKAAIREDERRKAKEDRDAKAAQAVADRAKAKADKDAKDAEREAAQQKTKEERDARAAQRDADRARTKADREAKTVQREAGQLAAKAERDTKAAEKAAELAKIKADRETKAAEREATRVAAKNERDAKAAQREADRAKAADDRAAKAAEREAARVAAKEQRDAKAAEREAQRAKAKEDRETAAAQREVERTKAKDDREAKAAQRDVDRATAKAERDAKSAARDVERAVKKQEREDRAAARDADRAAAKADREVKAAARAAEAAERRAEREIRAAEKVRKAYFTGGGVTGAAGRLLTDLTTGTARSVTSAPVSAYKDRRYSTTSVTEGGGLELRNLAAEAAKGESKVARFFSVFKRGAKDGESAVGSLGSRVKAFFEDINRPRAGGSGGSLGGDIAANFLRLSDSMGKSIDGVRRHLFSFQSLIVVVIAALGPLAAVLGAVGAAALGVASNMVSLVGVLGALPGLVGAAVGAFGALALVMKPISSVFSAYSAAQKAATTSTNAATTASLNYKEALLNEQQAELAYNRALQDKPRAVQKLAEARRQAARDIQDYRLQLQKLKFDEEGAALGVESAELDYRKSLVDPTATNLDRRIALHGVEGARFDQRDQTVAGGRLKEDSAAAFAKGVDGSDAVIEAQRGVEDATNNVTAAYINWQQAIVAVSKASAENKAGGPQAAALQAEIDKLPPKTRKVVLALIDLADEYKKMRDRLSDNIFGPISGDTGKFRDILKSLEAFLSPASKAVGDFAKKALDLLTNAEWKKFFSDQGKESGYIIKQLGDALLYAADAFRNITEVARPFTRFVVDGIKGMAKAFDGFASSEQGRDKIAAFLKNTQKRIEEIWPIIKNLAGGFAGFFAALNTAGGGQADFTTWFNKGLLTASETFKKLGDQARDPNSGFQQWLRNVRPLLHDVVEFLKSGAKFFGDLFSDQDNMDEASKTLQQISQRWLPALADIFDKLSQSGVVSKVAEGLSGAFEAINKFLDAGGIGALSAVGTALQTVGDVVNFISTVISWLTDHLPFFGTALAGIGTVIAFVFGAAIVAKFSGLIGIGKVLIGTFKGIRDVIASIKWDKIPLINKIPGIGGNGGDGNGKPMPTKPTKPGGGGPTVIEEGGSTAGITGHLVKIEALLRQIAINTGGVGNVDVDADTDSDGKTKPGMHRPTTKGGRLVGLAGEADEIAEGAAATGVLGKFGKIFKKIPGINKLPGIKPSTAANVVEDVAAAGTKPGIGKLLTGGLKGGLIATAASIAASLGTQALTDKYVKDDEDKASLNNAASTVASYAGGGALLGNIIPIPGVGAAIGGVAGGVVGGIKALATDKNLRNFISDKVPGSLGALGGLLGGTDPKNPGAKPGGISGILGGVGGALGSAGSAVGGAFGAVGGALSTAGSAIGGKASDIGGAIMDSLDKAAGKVKDFFTKTIPNAFDAGVKGIKTFFTKTLPGLPAKAAYTISYVLARAFVFLTEDLPRIVGKFFVKDLPSAAKKAWHFVQNNLWDPFVDFIKSIPGFFTKTIPHWFSSAWKWFKAHVLVPVVKFITQTIPNFFVETIPKWYKTSNKWLHEHVIDPIKKFVTETIPKFFTDTIPNWFKAAPEWFKTHVIDPITDFFTIKLPKFFTEDIPNAIKGIPDFVMNTLVKPVVDFFTGIWDHIKSGAKDAWEWAKGLFSSAAAGAKAGAADQRAAKPGMMSGGLVAGIYQGIQDTAGIMATPGEFMVRKSRVDEPGAKAFLRDFNDGRVTMADLYSGLSAATAPQVMSMVPPNAKTFTGKVPTVVNNTVNHAPVMGDVTINNPVRERSEHSLRRQVQIAAIRHRR